MAHRIGVLLILTAIVGGMIFAQGRPAHSSGQIVAAGVSVNSEIPGWGLALAAVTVIGAWAVAMFRITTFGKYHGLHFDHAKDEERHWTKRERDGLDDKLCEIQADLKTLLQRHK